MSKTKSGKWIQTLLAIGTVGLFILIAGSLTIQLINSRAIKNNIRVAVKEYSGSAEDALIAYMLDESKSPQGRTHTAIWTLGQIRSNKALPCLQEFYQDDPKGNTCYGHHDSLLCQMEIYKAITKIEGIGLFSNKRLKTYDPGTIGN